jgi:periplasmic divalent cation tolerance protein
MQNPDTSADEAPRVVLITAPDGEVARALARGLVEQRLAACANLLPAVTSVYRWEGAVQEDAEVLLVVKTVRARLEALEAYLDEHHPYDVPECVALAPAAVSDAYLAWLRAGSSHPGAAR